MCWETFRGGGGFGLGIAATGMAGGPRVGRTPASNCSLALLTDPFLSGAGPPGRGPGCAPGPELAGGFELIDPWLFFKQVNIQTRIEVWWIVCKTWPFYSIRVRSNKDLARLRSQSKARVDR